jgi:hypothetical protein
MSPSQFEQEGLGQTGPAVGNGGLDKGKHFQRRHDKKKKYGVQNLGKPDTKRLVRGGGVMCLSVLFYYDDSFRGNMRNFMKKLLRDCITIMEYDGMKTLTEGHVIYTLGKNNKSV